MYKLSIDIETYSSVDIRSSGLYKYAQSPDFEILLFAYSLNDGPVQIVDLAQGEKIPYFIVSIMQHQSTILKAYNAAFEWYCLKIAGYETTINQWRCTMLHGLYCGYTAGLGPTGAALGLDQDKRKLSTGTNLIRYFCVPCKPTKTNGGRLRNLPTHDEDKWKLFKEYCIQDVITEMEIEKKLSNFPVLEQEQLMWQIDQKINAFGIKIDSELVQGALRINDILSNEQMIEAVSITGLGNPNSTAQLLPWLKENVSIEIENLQKETVSELISKLEDSPAKRVLEIRQELSKTSIKKYVAMREVKGKDERVRGLLQFYGANRTGRWAGRLIQVQNLPRNYIDTLDYARELIKDVKIEHLKVIYGNISDTLSQVIRTAFIPSTNNKFIVADFSAIEARVIAWLAEEQWRLEVFKTHGKIYEASASQMFGVPIDKITKGNDEYALRQKGKVAELALGYQGSSGALKAMGALDMGLSEDELPDIVGRWRAANKRIVDLWYKVQNAAVRVMETGQQQAVKNIIFSREGDLANNQDFLTIKLPSGRKLFYVNPGTRENSWGATVITYKSVNQTTRKWECTDTYGGKLVENIVQAIARDCLAESILKVHNAGHNIVMSIHDEIVIDSPKNVTVDEICDIMGEPISWAQGLILRADGFESEYYKKD